MMTTKPPYADKVKEVTYEEAKLLRSLGVAVGADWIKPLAWGAAARTRMRKWEETASPYLYSTPCWLAATFRYDQPDYKCFFFIAKDDDCGQA